MNQPVPPPPAAPASNTGARPAARALNATKWYGHGDTAVAALRGVSVDFAAGQFTAVMGASGSGKSTLMHCLAGLDTLTSGQVFVGDTDLSQLDSQFTASESGEHDGLAWLRLASKAKEPEFEYAELGFDAASLQRMRFKDQLGNVTEIRFSDWKRNPALPADAFRFTPPEGVDVVGDVKPDAEVMPLRD